METIRKLIYDLTSEEAVLKKVCICCKKNIDPDYRNYSEKEVDIYIKEGMCPKCWGIAKIGQPLPNSPTTKVRYAK